MTAEVRQALDGLDEEASVDEVATRLEGRVSPAALALEKAQAVQAGGSGAVTRAVDGFGGFAKQYEQIEKVSAHHGNFWVVLLYGQTGPGLGSNVGPSRQGRGWGSRWSVRAVGCWVFSGASSGAMGFAACTSPALKWG